MTTLKEPQEKLKDKRYWKKDRYSDNRMLTEAGKRIRYKIEEEKMRLKEEKENDPVYKTKKIIKACNKLFKSLTDLKEVPDLTSKISITKVYDDYIRPTREYRKFIYELDEHEKAGLYNWLTFTEAYINDMLEILEEARKGLVRND
jgi:hypothetical protein